MLGDIFRDRNEALEAKTAQDGGVGLENLILELKGGKGASLGIEMIWGHISDLRKGLELSMVLGSKEGSLVYSLENPPIPA